MGILSWFFPSAEDRVARARRLLAEGRAADARYDLLDNDAPGAKELLAEVQNTLARLNLEEAVVRCRADDDRGVAAHLALAEEFHSGGLEEAFRSTRRELRELRKSRREGDIRRKEEEQARLMSVDPLGMSGGPSWLDPVAPGDLYDADRDEIEARLALLVENYPEDLRQNVGVLGAAFARAVLDLDEGRADLALQALVELPQDDPLVCWELSRAAHALGDPGAAARSLRHLGERLGGHRSFGSRHSGVTLAQLMAESGDVQGALRTLRSVRADAPDVGGALFAQLLEAVGKLDDAERVLVALIKKHRGAVGLYTQLARIRLKGGHRVQAMRALEATFSVGCSTPGKCGYRPPELAIVRPLATLYYEDGIELERAAELAAQAAQLVTEPTWEDAYLSALHARRQERPEAHDLITRLREATPAGPNLERVLRYL